MNLPLGICRLVDWRWHAGQIATALIPTLLNLSEHTKLARSG
jgi:hypothetical protein